MSIARETIIDAVQQALAARPEVLAVWLEGSEATGSVDEYSDIDLCCSVSDLGALDGAVACARAALEGLGRLDLVGSEDRDSDMRSARFHLEGTSPYLLVDFDAYYRRGSAFTEGDEIEKPRVLFDRAGVVTFAPVDARALREGHAARLEELESMVAQHARIEKYVRRGEFLEALGYYHRWLLAPLVEALRLRYTPLHPEYSIVHISRHLPAEVVRKVEDLFQISSLEEIETKMPAALAWFEETDSYLRDADLRAAGVRDQ